MIRMPGIIEQVCFFDLVFQGIAYKMVVNAPAFIGEPYFLAETLRPPGVFDFIRIGMPETVHKPDLEEAGKPFAFFRQKPRAFFVAYGIMNINRVVADIYI